MPMNSKTIFIKVFKEGNSTSSREYLERYFKERLKCGIPSSMPCLCCNRLMVRPKQQHSEEYKQRHRYMIGTKIISENASGIIAICEDCYNKGLKQELQIFEDDIIKG